LKEAAIVFDPRKDYAKDESRWYDLARRCVCTVEKAKEVMIAADPFNIIPCVKKFISEIAAKKEKFIYLGVSSSNDGYARINAHVRLHGALQFDIINTYEDRFLGFGAEGVGIAYIESVAKEFKNVMNCGEGWEKEALAGSGKVIRIYMYATENPYSRINNSDNAVGLLRNTTRPEIRDVNKFWCVHCQKNLVKESGLSAHMDIHARVNVKCTHCDRMFVNDEGRLKHEEMHTLTIRCPKNGCTVVENYEFMRRYHFKVD
jgi:hypothetical protein